MYKLLERITQGSATPADLVTLEELCTLIRETSLCGLGQNAPNPVVSTLRYFREEYEAHIGQRQCPAGVCTFNQVPVLELMSRPHTHGANGANGASPEAAKAKR
jgi:bidirectional [NiFe] hydrogenase diaphorase subunit